jgi:hypothetical protein
VTQNISSARRTPALIALGLRLLSLLLLIAYVSWRGSPSRALQLLDLGLSGTVYLLWTLLLAGYLGGGVARTTDPRLRALRALYPLATAYSLSLWLLTTLSVLGSPDANPLSGLLLLGSWLAALLLSLAIYGLSARLFAHPEDAAGRTQLAGWLNIAAALSVAGTLMNLYPPFPDTLTALGRGVYLLDGVLDVTALLTLRWALGAGRPLDRKA